ncbi:PSD1 and planctomycete cytochrome C domain-containing protein [Lacipirellula sp.]|uniref:PSD1 and planctomycete cytochrome C domain-containing protein n=1 Tax=Lacipirellula sp. TaxID=2691419 RepID=UPI003D0A8EB8
MPHSPLERDRAPQQWRWRRFPCKLARLTVFLLLATICPATRGAERKIDYNRDVRPILSENCFACHGFDEAGRQADLRLDEADSALADRDGLPAIVAGDAEASEAWRRIASDDESEVMPPVDSHRELTAEQKEILRQWIDEGAVYAKHWAFIPPVKAAEPTLESTWPRNEIDQFVLARLEDEGLQPSPAADRRMVIRRLYLDLTGLPPSAEEVEAFVADERLDAYERSVDQLLASPHFGERMALEWLDAARYADTNGFSIDGGRHMWVWRDWVISAFNENMPYDQFLYEQLAGDLIPNHSDDQLVASGFQRNNMVTHEGGTIPEENLTNYNADRVKTLGEAVLGLTLGCAQCHDHKYDPLTQREYYQFFAYFNTLSDIGLDGNAGVNPRPYFQAKTTLPDTELPELQRRIAELKQALAAPDTVAIESWAGEHRAKLAARGRDFVVKPAKLLKVSAPNRGFGFGVEADRFARVTQPEGMVAYDMSLELPADDRPMTGLRIVFHHDDKAPGGGRGHGKMYSPEAGAPDQGTFVVTSFSASVDVVPGDQINLHRLLDAKQVTANSWRDDYRPEHVLNTLNDNGWSPKIAVTGPAHLTVTFNEPIFAKQTPYLTAQVNFGHGNALSAAKFEFEAVYGEDPDSDLPAEVIAAVERSVNDRSDADLALLAKYYAEHGAPAARQRIELANLEERVRVLTEKFSTMVMDQAETPRETFILERGNYAAPTEKVTPGTPAALPALPEGAPANRLGLAQWAIMPNNPLTARVAVNRTWQTLFGTGIVKTTADFGAQGEWPSHPELLDWLAVDFIEHGWDVKRLVRQIATSATYRQTSAASVELIARDPANQLLARGPRFRLSAEFIRDGALKSSGLLVDRVGGPSVNPYMPGDLWREISHYGSSPATSQAFVQDHGEKLYRRSLYTYWKRTVPPPNMAAFDAPNREICTIQRASTTTPLQALVMLNDVQFVEATRALAERMIGHGGDDATRLRWGFEECTSRAPTDEELVVLAEMLGRERSRYAADEPAAKEYLTGGESVRDEQIPLAEHAAWSQVASLMMNLSEAVTRN